jgi:hypothetical protein
MQTGRNQSKAEYLLLHELEVHRVDILPRELIGIGIEVPFFVSGIYLDAQVSRQLADETLEYTEEQRIELFY